MWSKCFISVSLGYRLLLGSVKLTPGLQNGWSPAGKLFTQRNNKTKSKSDSGIQVPDPDSQPWNILTFICTKSARGIFEVFTSCCLYLQANTQVYTAVCLCCSAFVIIACILCMKWNASKCTLYICGHCRLKEIALKCRGCWVSFYSVLCGKSCPANLCTQLHFSPLHPFLIFCTAYIMTSI